MKFELKGTPTLEAGVDVLPDDVKSFEPPDPFASR
jgi:hypothetical protein